MLDRLMKYFMYLLLIVLYVFMLPPLIFTGAVFFLVAMITFGFDEIITETLKKYD